MSNDRPLKEWYGVHRWGLCGLCASISIALSITFVLASNNTYAATNELENEYFSFVVEEIIDRGLPCSSADMGHILYEDDLVAVLEVTCESGESYEVIDIYNFESIIIEPIDKITDEEMDNYFNRISYSTK